MSDGNRTRVISGAVLVCILAAVAWFGGFMLLAAVGFIAVFGLHELFKVLGMKASPICKAAMVLSVLYLPLLYFLREYAAIPFFTAGFLTFAIITVRLYPTVPFHEFAYGAAALVYLPFMSGFMYLVRTQEAGVWLFILIYLSSWLGDVFGYAIGRRFGKHKMTPVLSPKKSIEGLAAEIIGVSVVCLIYGVLVKNKLESYSMPVLKCAVCGFAGSILSVFGDLFASAIKREFGIKDYGTLIPGHGGILDRFDSALFTAPLVYVLFCIF